MKSYWHVYGIWVFSMVVTMLISTFIGQPPQILRFLDSLFYSGLALFLHYLATTPKKAP